MRREEIIHSKEIKLAIYLKINQLKREELSTLSYSHILQVLFAFTWKKRLPLTIHKAIDDIMHLQANEIVSCLHTLAIIEGSQIGVDKIEHILGGEYHG